MCGAVVVVRLEREHVSVPTRLIPGSRLPAGAGSGGCGGSESEGEGEGGCCEAFLVFIPAVFTLAQSGFTRPT